LQVYDSTFFDAQTAAGPVVVGALPAGVVSGGLDLADLDRLALALRRSGRGFRDRVLRPAEADLTGADPQLFATLFGVKESVVKAMRGLPPGGRLPDIELTVPPQSGGPPVEVRLHGALSAWALRHDVTVLAGVAAGTPGVALTWAAAVPAAAGFDLARSS
jgi:phosphopantetheinyl transferase (holo-ACP synthase)